MLSYAYLAGARLDNANLTGASPDRVVFHGQNASLVGANLELCDFTRADLVGLTFTGTPTMKAMGANFTEAVLSHTTFAAVDLTVAWCESASEPARLTDAVLCGASLTSTDLSGADLAGAHIPAQATTYVGDDNKTYSCPAATRTDLFFSTDTICPDGTPPTTGAACGEGQWTSSSSPPGVCCQYIPGGPVCPRRKNCGECTTDCNCADGKTCEGGLCAGNTCKK